MADNYLITGYWGEPHVTAENDRGINAAMFGTGRFVLPVGEQFKAEYIGNNTIRMYDGKLMDNGAAAGIPVGEYVDLLIANAGQGMKRNDLIVFQYSQDASTLIESGVFTVIQGTETSGTASDPALTQADLLSGEADFDQMALWRVSVSGTTISAPAKMFSVKTANQTEAKDHIQNKSNPHGVTAGQVGARPNTWTPTASEVGAVAKNALKTLAYSQTDENGNTSVLGIASYPTTPGVFRVVNPVTGLPSGCLGYGSLVIFDGGSYVLHLYQDADDSMYWARTDNGVTSPGASGWHRIYDNVNKPTASDVGAVPAIESTDHPGCYYRMVGGNTEWINPPVGIGVEYRTTERWNGKAVYTQLVDMGNLPNKGEKHISLVNCFVGTRPNFSVVRYEYILTLNEQGVYRSVNPTKISQTSTGSIFWSVVDPNGQQWSAYVHTDFNASAATAMGQIWYTID